MARQEDVERANRLLEIENQIAELQKGTSTDLMYRQETINQLKKEEAQLTEEIKSTEDKIVTSRKAQAKIGQQTLKIERE